MSSTIADHSQNGEFLELLKLIVARGAPGKNIVDAGANGRERSNSYDLMLLFGWRGLLIEANPALADKIGPNSTESITHLSHVLSPISRAPEACRWE